MCSIATCEANKTQNLKLTPQASKTCNFQATVKKVLEKFFHIMIQISPVKDKTFALWTKKISTELKTILDYYQLWKQNVQPELKTKLHLPMKISMQYLITSFESKMYNLNWRQNCICQWRYQCNTWLPALKAKCTTWIEDKTAFANEDINAILDYQLWKQNVQPELKTKLHLPMKISMQYLITSFESKMYNLNWRQNCICQWRYQCNTWLPALKAYNELSALIVKCTTWAS